MSARITKTSKVLDHLAASGDHPCWDDMVDFHKTADHQLRGLRCLEQGIVSPVIAWFHHLQPQVANFTLDTRQSCCELKFL